MKLNRLTDRIWVFPFEEERDRPNLSYIRGDRWSLAVDAGHSEAHTDDSTLIHAVSESVLFLGDAEGGIFPTWEKDQSLCQKLADTIAAVDADICLESHWTPVTKREMLDDLLADT